MDFQRSATEHSGRFQMPDQLNVGGHGPALERARHASLDLRGVVRDYVDTVIDPVELSRRVSAPDARSAAALQAQAVLQAEHAGHTITLEDFGTVGAGGDASRSWLPARTEVSAPFSTSNPGRTWRP